jgi:hypothetical protein
MSLFDLRREVIELAQVAYQEMQEHCRNRYTEWKHPTNGCVYIFDHGDDRVFYALRDLHWACDDVYFRLMNLVQTYGGGKSLNEILQLNRQVNGAVR